MRGKVRLVIACGVKLSCRIHNNSRIITWPAVRGRGCVVVIVNRCPRETSIRAFHGQGMVISHRIQATPRGKSISERVVCEAVYEGVLASHVLEVIHRLPRLGESAVT